MSEVNELVKAINEVERIVRDNPPDEALKKLLAEPVPYKEVAIMHLLVIYASRLQFYETYGYGSSAGCDLDDLKDVWRP